MFVFNVLHRIEKQSKKLKMDKKPEPKPAEKPPTHQPGDGIRSMRSTTLFRAVNFELYAKPVSIFIEFRFQTHRTFIGPSSTK